MVVTRLIIIETRSTDTRSLIMLPVDSIYLLTLQSFGHDRFLTEFHLKTNDADHLGLT
jgi:hypothetical protein